MLDILLLAVLQTEVLAPESSHPCLHSVLRAPRGAQCRPNVTGIEKRGRGWHPPAPRVLKDLWYAPALGGGGDIEAVTEPTKS